LYHLSISADKVNDSYYFRYTYRPSKYSQRRDRELALKDLRGFDNLLEVIILTAASVRSIQQVTTHREEYAAEKKQREEDWRQLTPYQQQSQAAYSVMMN
jgi:hypothetical protein